jgi:cobalt-zinc-cadmium efflux system outer membrane protein
MRRLEIVGVIVSLSIVLVRPAVAQPEVSVDDLVERAVREHPDLQAARLDVEAAAARVRQAALRPNPMVDVGGQKALGPDNNLMIGLTVPLDLNGRKEGRVGVAERELDLKRALVAERERRLRADVRMKAGEVLVARRNLAVTTELLETNRQALRLVRDRVREGATPALDENLQLLEVSRLETTDATQRSRLEVASLQLKTVAGLPIDAPLSVSGDLATPVELPDRERALAQGVANRPDVVAARAEAAMAAARVRKEQAEGRWDASINIGYQRQDFGYDLRGLTASGATKPIQDVFHYFGGGVTVMLPVRNRNQGNVAAAAAETRAAERRQQLVDLTARQEVMAAFAQVEGARRAHELYARGVRDVARRNLDLVRRAYGLGRGSLLDVIAEQRRYIEIENGYTEALKQLYDAMVDLERAVGVGK